MNSRCHIRCSNCKFALFDEKWGEWKCTKHSRRPTGHELVYGCKQFTMGEAETKKVRNCDD